MGARRVTDTFARMAPAPVVRLLPPHPSRRPPGRHLRKWRRSCAGCPLSLVSSPPHRAAPRAQQAPATGTVVIRAARLIDGTGAPAIKTGCDRHRRRILAVGRSGRVTIPAARARRPGRRTLPPGSRCAHPNHRRNLGDPEADAAAVKDSRPTGHPCVGDAEGRCSPAHHPSSARRHFELRRPAHSQGDQRQPDRGTRIQRRPALGITGGHCGRERLRPGLFDNGIEQGIANGPAEVRAAVAVPDKSTAPTSSRHARRGVLSGRRRGRDKQYDFDELKAMVDEAAKHERPRRRARARPEGIRSPLVPASHRRAWLVPRRGGRTPHARASHWLVRR